jgi:Tfp pilus assembly protein FimT
MRAGLSLIESLLILAVLAVVVGLTLPRLDTASFRADTGARQLRAALAQARALAVERRSDVIVSVDTIGNRVRLLHDVNGDGKADLGEEALWQRLTGGVHFVSPASGVNGAPSPSVSGNNIIDVESMPSLVFRDDGSAASSLQLYIRAEGRIKTAVRAVTLEDSAAAALSYRATDNKWKPYSGRGSKDP